MAHQPANDSVLESFLKPSDRHRCLALDSGLAALDSRRWLVQNARRRIWMSSFLWRNDRAGNFLLKELAARAQRGVEVRLLLDHWGTMGTTDSILPRLRQVSESAGFEVKLFNPIVKKIKPHQWQVAMALASSGTLLNHRMHGKLALFDDRAAIIGGRNVGDEYFDLHMFRCFYDAELLIAGPTVEKLLSAFESYWDSHLTETLSNFRLPVDLEPKTHSTETHNGNWESLVRIAQKSHPLSNAMVFEPSSLEVVVDSPNVDQQPPTQTAIASLEFCRRAQQNLRITSPILIFRNNWLKELVELRRQCPGLELSMVTNSLVSTDNLFTYAAGLPQRRRLLRDLNVHLYEIRPNPEDMAAFIPSYTILQQTIEQSDEQPESGFGSNKFECQRLHTTLHGKFAVADDDFLLIGSPNLDPRSLIFNTELVVLIRDRKMSRFFSDIHDRWRLNRNSWAVAESKQWPWPEWRAKFLLAWHRLTGWGLWPYRSSRCYAPNKNTPNEIPNMLADDFYQRYQECGRYPGVEDSERQVELAFLENISTVFRELL